MIREIANMVIDLKIKQYIVKFTTNQERLQSLGVFRILQLIT